MLSKLLRIITLAVLTLSPVFADEGVILHFFYSKSCEHCAEVREKKLEPMQKKYAESLKVVEFEIEDNMANYEKLIEMEELFGRTGNEIPVVFLGDSVFSGTEDFTPYLNKLMAGGKPSPSAQTAHSVAIDSSLAAPETHDSIAEIEVDKKYPVFMAFFWERGCQHCDRVTYDIQLLKKRHTTLVVKDWDVEDKTAKQYAEALAIRLGVEEKLHLATPAVFLADTAFITDAISFHALDSAISRLETIPDGDTVWVFSEDELEAADKFIVDRFRKFEIAPVIAAGLLDGLNPCAFGAIIFFITFLTVVKRKRREIFWVGVSFTLSVFFTYLLVGAGFLRFLQALPFLQTFARWVYIITGVLVVVLGIISIYDFFRSLKGNYGDMLLQLPDNLKSRIHNVIIAENQPRAQRNTVIAAISTGFLVSVLELACTGQVYLPTIIYVMGAPGLKAKAYLFLTLYNLMFIVPLAVVFAVVFFGTTSEQLTKFLKKNTPIIKLLTACIFFTMAFFMLRTIL